MLFLTSVDYTTWRIPVWVVLVSERRTQIIAWCAFSVKFFKKSDTAVALRRSVSIILCIIVVSFINVYYEYFCKLMWLSAKSPDVNMNFIRTKHTCIV